jgi:hypothetical protein
MRGTAECSAHKRVERGYHERQAICAQDVMLKRQEIRRQEDVRPEGCAYMRGGQPLWRCVVAMAVVEGVMQVR